jgi:uncharacterized membrane protein (Fun14 family)
MAADEKHDESKRDATERAPRRIPMWKKALLVASVILMVAGLGLKGYAMIRGDDVTTGMKAPSKVNSDDTTALNPDLAPGFAGGEPVLDLPGTSPSPSSTTEDPSGLDAFSPAMFRMGFGFFVGFCIAFAMRTFMKISLLGIGLMLLALVGLQYAGVIDVNWGAMESHYDRFAGWIGGQTDSFQKFVTGYLPSSAAGVFGMVLGFRRS